jgi:cell division protein ZapE
LPDAATAFRRAYEAKLDEDWAEDPAQEVAVGHLARLLAALSSASTRGVKGLYLHGPVGRGKSQLLNLFMEHTGAVPARRTHMHTFMGEIHQRLFDIKTGDPVKQTAAELAAECRVLGFDEFYVTNIADGMLLGRLFERLFKHGIIVVATSNWPIAELYQDGRNRKGFLPFLRVIERHLTAVDLGDGRDYRRPDDPRWPLYVLAPEGSSPSPQLESLYQRYGGKEREGGVVVAGSAQEGCGWYRFEDLCEQPLGRAEYTELLCGLDTLIVEGLPRFRSAQVDAVLRFVTLIDLCYELKRRVIISGPDYPEALYPEGLVLTAFRRAASRLAEMQGWA